MDWRLVIMIFNNYFFYFFTFFFCQTFMLICPVNIFFFQKFYFSHVKTCTIKSYSRITNLLRKKDCFHPSIGHRRTGNQLELGKIGTDKIFCLIFIFFMDGEISLLIF